MKAKNANCVFKSLEVFELAILSCWKLLKIGHKLAVVSFDFVLVGVQTLDIQYLLSALS